MYKYNHIHKVNQNVQRLNNRFHIKFTKGYFYGKDSNGKFRLIESPSHQKEIGVFVLQNDGLYYIKDRDLNTNLARSDKKEKYIEYKYDYIYRFEVHQIDVDMILQKEYL